MANPDAFAAAAPAASEAAPAAAAKVEEKEEEKEESDDDMVSLVCANFHLVTPASTGLWSVRLICLLSVSYSCCSCKRKIFFEREYPACVII